MIAHCTRRHLVTGGLAMIATGAAARRHVASFFRGSGLPIGIEMVTVEDAARADLATTFARLARIGYREIELPGLLGHQPEQIRSAADRAGLRITAVHVLSSPLRPGAKFTFEDKLSDVARVMTALGARDVIVPLPLFPHGFRLQEGEDVPAAFARGITAAGLATWERTAAFLNRQGAALREIGLRLGYHNHNFEFAQIGGTTAFQTLLAQTDPHLVNFELDVGWVAAAGADPIDFVRTHGRRIRWLHMKDIAVTTKANFEMRLDPIEVGSGKIDWRNLLPAAYEAGVRHFYVEQEPPFRTSPLDAAAKSYAYLWV